MTGGWKTELMGHMAVVLKGYIRGVLSNLPIVGFYCYCIMSL